MNIDGKIIELWDSDLNIGIIVSTIEHKYLLDEILRKNNFFWCNGVRYGSSLVNDEVMIKSINKKKIVVYLNNGTWGAYEDMEHIGNILGYDHKIYSLDWVDRFIKKNKSKIIRK